jgi:hypothetical protein
MGGVALAALVAIATYLRGGFVTGDWLAVGSLVLIPATLFVAWMPWSVVSVTFDRAQGRMAVRRSLYPLRQVRDRRLADLRAILVVRFKGLPFAHVRLSFGESDPRQVELAAYWGRSGATGLAGQLSGFLGIPVTEVTFPPTRRKKP